MEREIKLILVRDLGIKDSDHGVRYRYGLFKCAHCGSQVERIMKDGIKAKVCSHKCYAELRGRRGAYKSGIVTISGYEYQYMPSHPNATKKGYVAVHRLVAEKNIGRFLREEEVAHHINEIKTDNRPENIQVMTWSEHARYHKSQSKRQKNGQFTI